MNRTLTAIAGEKDAGRRVKYFVRGDMGVSYGQFSSLKQRNGLLVNGISVHANHILRPGDAVTVVLADVPGEKAVAPEEGPVRIVYEDEDLIILDKPAPLACQCSPKQPGGTLENRLAFLYRDRPGFVFRPLNRLDRGTSGLMAAAMNAHAAQRLQRQLHTDAFVREYLAVVEGRMEGEGTIDAPVIKEDAATVRRVVDFESGKPAVTHYRVEQAGDRFSLVRLRLETGRTHQIRVHLSHIGHPIVGDFLYGTEEPRLPGRFALHSTFIRLAHPVTGEAIERTSALPDGLAALMDIEFRKLTDFNRGIMYDILRDAYSFDERYAACWEENWRQADAFFFDNPTIADRYGFVTCFRGEPVGFICWDPRNRPGYVEIGHNAIRTAWKGRGFGKIQLNEAIRRIKEYEGLREIRVCTNSGLIAPKNYESVGFALYDRRENRDEAAFSGDYLYYKIQLRQDQGGANA